MKPEYFTESLILTGPTASGKSALALELAERFNAEILCMDSMTLYRGMNIGTAKPSEADQARIPHHLIDLLDPWESGNVAWWLRKAKFAYDDIAARGKRVLFVGGTPFYLKALLCGIFEGPEANEVIRNDLEELSSEELKRCLADFDPVLGNKLHINDRKRIIRAIEVYRLTGKPLSDWQREFNRVLPRKFTPLWIDWPRSQLYYRIDSRVEKMMQSGWIEESKKLLALPHPMSKQASQAAGYQELFEYHRGTLSWEQAVEKTKLRTRQLAKRQLTWFRNIKECLPLTGNISNSAMLDDCLHCWSLQVG